MVLARTSQTTEALDGLRKGRAIVVRLRALSPDNATLLGDLAWFDGEIVRLGGRPDDE